MLRRRLLRAQGWRVVPVPFWEWAQLAAEERGGGSRAERERAYMQQLLRDHGVSDHGVTPG